MTASLVELLQGVHPGIAQLFARIELPKSVWVDARIESTLFVPVDGMDLVPTGIEECVWRVLCDPGEVRHAALRSYAGRRGVVALCCALGQRIYLGLADTNLREPTPGSAWPVLRPYGRGKPETLLRKFREWVRDDQPLDITDCVQWIQPSDAECGFLQAFKQTDDKVEALAVFGDYLEENADDRVELIRRVIDYAGRG